MIENANRKEEVFQFITAHTEKALLRNDLNNLGYDASLLSIDLHIDRSNVSRILNLLSREGLLIKTQGRPTLFIAREPISKNFPGHYIPLIIPKSKTLIDYLAPAPAEVESISNEPFSFVGSSVNESLHLLVNQIESTILYPNNLLIVNIKAEVGSGSHFITEQILAIGKRIQRFNNKTSLLSVDLAPYELMKDKFIAEIDALFEDSSINALFFHHLDHFPVSLLNYIMFKATQWINKERLLVFVSTDRICEENSLFLSQFCNQSFDLVNLDSRTIKEKLELTLMFIQEEADAIRTSISFSTGVLSCFVMSRYPNNILGLRTQIKKAIATAYTKSKRHNTIVLNIDFDDIDDAVLDNIYDVSNRMGQLYSLFDLFDNEVLIFIPNSKNRFYDTIHNSTIDSQEMIEAASRTSLTSFSRDIIHRTEDIEINTIRSLLVSEIYSLLYPILSATTIAQNENIMYGFFLEVNRIIEGNSTVPKTYKHDDGSYFPSPHSIEVASDIIDSVESFYRITIEPHNKDFINTYISLAIKLTTEAAIPLLILCHGDSIAENYAMYMNSLNESNKFEFLNYNTEDQRQSLSLFITKACAKVSSMDLGRGVVIVSDVEPLTSLENTITKQTGIKTVIISPISLPLLINITEHVQSIENDLESIRKMYSSTELGLVNTEHITQGSNTSNKLIDDISSRILATSLIFLDPNKITQVLFNTLLKILEELKLNYTDEIAIRFLIHSSFMVERSIKGDSLTSKRMTEIINNHSDIYHIIDKNFIEINNIFGIKIKQAEISLVAEIFIEYINNIYAA